MSIVTVHGPYMMYGGGGGIVTDDPNIVGVPNPNNALQYTFSVTSTRAAADFSWNFGTGASPATASATKGPTVVTYPANTTANVVMTVAAGAGTPAPGTYTEVIRSGTGAIPRAEEGQQGQAEGQQTQAPEEGVEDYDPGDFTVAEVVNDVEAENDPDFTLGVIEAEQAGKDRSTLIAQLQDLYTQQTAT